MCAGDAVITSGYSQNSDSREQQLEFAFRSSRPSPG
jgi:hypothetical protein